jgi:alpha-beta hydrolase superfamily lysophospholipase
VTYDTFLLETHDAVPVVVHRWQPDGQVRGVINLVHGMAEHARRYAHVGEALNDAGYALYAADLRGHGETAQSDDDLGLFAERRGWAKVLDDLHRITVRARGEHPEAPVVLFGHSMGTFLVQHYLFTFTREVDGAILSAPAPPPGPLAEVGAIVSRGERLRLGARGHSPVLRELIFGRFNRAFRPNRTEFDWLSRDEEQVDRYVADPRCGFECRVQFYADMFAGVRLVQQPDRIARIPADLPILLIAGEHDPMGGVVGVPKNLAFLERCGLTNVGHRIYEGARHELVNEINREEVIADLIAWIDLQVDALEPSRRVSPVSAGE